MAVQMGEHGKGCREMPQAVRPWSPGAEVTREGGTAAGLHAPGTSVFSTGRAGAWQVQCFQGPTQSSGLVLPHKVPQSQSEGPPISLSPFPPLQTPLPII